MIRAVVAAVCVALAAAFAVSVGARTQQSGQLPTLPLTQLDERALAADLDNRTFTLTFAQPVPVRELLLLLVRGTNLSIVPDPGIAGSFIGELKNVTVRQALGLILPPLGLDYSVDGPFIRVFRREPETRLFDINYIATTRTGTSRVGSGPSPSPGSYVRVESTTDGDLFAEIAKGVQTLLSDRGAFNVDRKAGLLQVTDFPERLERVAVYLDAVHDHVHRQVQIDARVLEVELNDVEAASLDWAALAPPSATLNRAARPMLSGLRAGDVPRFLAALGQQGKVSVLASPRVLALNNQPAVVRAASRSVERESSRDDEEFTLGVTAQITAEGVIMLSITPIVSVRASAGGNNRNPVVTAFRETDTLARVGDGETMVIAGFTREQFTRERKSGGPTSGWFGRSTVETRKRVELVILLTLKIVNPVGTQ